jgi:hypothetical protein
VLTNDPGMGVIRHIDSGDAADDAPLQAHPGGGVRVPAGSLWVAEERKPGQAASGLRSVRTRKNGIETHS